MASPSTSAVSRHNACDEQRGIGIRHDCQVGSRVSTAIALKAHQATNFDYSTEVMSSDPRSVKPGANGALTLKLDSISGAGQRPNRESQWYHSST